MAAVKGLLFEAFCRLQNLCYTEPLQYMSAVFPPSMKCHFELTFLYMKTSSVWFWCCLFDHNIYMISSFFCSFVRLVVCPPDIKDKSNFRGVWNTVSAFFHDSCRAHQNLPALLSRNVSAHNSHVCLMNCCYETFTLTFLVDGLAPYMTQLLVQDFVPFKVSLRLCFSFKAAFGRWEGFYKGFVCNGRVSACSMSRGRDRNTIVESASAEGYRLFHFDSRFLFGFKQLCTSWRHLTIVFSTSRLSFFV